MATGRGAGRRDRPGGRVPGDIRGPGAAGARRPGPGRGDPPPAGGGGRFPGRVPGDVRRHRAQLGPRRAREDLRRLGGVPGSGGPPGRGSRHHEIPAGGVDPERPPPGVGRPDLACPGPPVVPRGNAAVVPGAGAGDAPGRPPNPVRRADQPAHGRHRPDDRPRRAEPGGDRRPGPGRRPGGDRRGPRRARRRAPVGVPGVPRVVAAVLPPGPGGRVAGRQDVVPAEVSGLPRGGSRPPAVDPPARAARGTRGPARAHRGGPHVLHGAAPGGGVRRPRDRVGRRARGRGVPGISGRRPRGTGAGVARRPAAGSGRADRGRGRGLRRCADRRLRARAGVAHRRGGGRLAGRAAVRGRSLRGAGAAAGRPGRVRAGLGDRAPPGSDPHRRRGVPPVDEPPPAGAGPDRLVAARPAPVAAGHLVRPALAGGHRTHRAGPGRRPVHSGVRRPPSRVAPLRIPCRGSPDPHGAGGAGRDGGVPAGRRRARRRGARAVPGRGRDAAAADRGRPVPGPGPGNGGPVGAPGPPARVGPGRRLPLGGPLRWWRHRWPGWPAAAWSG